jgi:hypothetical protein
MSNRLSREDDEIITILTKRGYQKASLVYFSAFPACLASGLLPLL